MARAVQDVRAHLREGMGLGVTLRPSLPSPVEQHAAAAARRAATFLRLLSAAPDLATLHAIRLHQSGGPDWSDAHDHLFAAREAELTAATRLHLEAS